MREQHNIFAALITLGPKYHNDNLPDLKMQFDVFPTFYELRIKLKLFCMDVLSDAWTLYTHTF